jgi:hypothetical protein
MHSLSRCVMYSSSGSRCLLLVHVPCCIHVASSSMLRMLATAHCLQLLHVFLFVPLPSFRNFRRKLACALYANWRATLKWSSADLCYVEEVTCRPL